MLTRQQALAGIAAAPLAASLFGTASAQSASDPLVLGAVSNDSTATMFYAQDLGYYKAAGLNTSVTIMAGSGPMSAAVANGTVPIAGVPVTLVSVARDKGLPLVMIAPLSLYVSSVPDHAIIVLKNSPIRKAADLNGKTIAVRDLGNLSYYGTKVWIDKNGGDSKTIKFVEVVDPQAVAAMQAGRVDAAAISEPALDPAMKNPDIRQLGLMLDAIAPRFLVAACVGSESWVKQHPDIVHTFADVIAKTSKWANANQSKSAPILEKYAQAPVAPGSLRNVYAERLRAADVQPVLDLMFATGQIKTPQHAADLFAPGVG
jgi:NitT/TauT family transport system substrate-binding protein